MNKKIILLVSLILLVLLSGCIQEQKLSEQELEEKAKECFYSIDEVKFPNFNNYSIKTTDFQITQKNSIHSTQYSNWENICWECGIDERSKGLCKEDFEKCKAFKGNIRVYEFQVKKEIQVPKELDIYVSRVILKDDGEPIGCYVSAFVTKFY